MFNSILIGALASFTNFDLQLRLTTAYFYSNREALMQKHFTLCSSFLFPAENHITF